MSTTPPASQTLARGLSILDLLAEAPGPLSIAEISAAISVHRSVAYRLLRTLQDFGLVAREPGGGIIIGPHLAVLARSVASDLQTAAQSALRRLADDLAMTAFLVVLDRADCVTLTTVEPSQAVASIAQRPGSRHPVSVGAPGVAIQTLLSADDRRERGLPLQEVPEVALARLRGWTASHGEVIPGVTAVAAPVRSAVPAAIAVLLVGDEVPAHVALKVRDAARSLARLRT
jgi:DNA-binding IclR family transcriptional regulator